MKYISQLAYPHWFYVTKTDMEKESDRIAGKTTSIKTSGCGLCSAVMVADRLLPNCLFDLKDALDLSYEVSANHKRGTDYTRFAPAFAEKLGFKVVFSRNMDEVCHCLRTGGAVVALVTGDKEDRPGLFSHGGHYIAIIGEEPDGRLAILDPSYSEAKYNEEGRQGKVEVKSGVILLSDVAYVEAEAKDYFLFWRQ